MIFHIYPLNDLREHECSSECWCHPTLDSEEEPDVWVHHSLDGRELHEAPEGAQIH